MGDEIEPRKYFVEPRILRFREFEGWAGEEPPPAELLAIWRGHWAVENRLHYLRDVTLGEDASQVRTGVAPEIMAALSNTTIALLRRAGHTAVSAGLCAIGWRTQAGAALALLGIHLS